MRPLVYTPSGRADEYARSTRYPDDKPIAANPRRGCTHGCKYCYAPSVLRMSREDFHADEVLVEKALERFDRDCERLQNQGNRAPIFLSFTCDPYCPAERLQGLTRRMIEIAHRHGQFVNLLTKGGKLAARDLDVLMPGDIFGITLTCFDGRGREVWEPNAASTTERIEVLRDAFQRPGIETRVSFEPVLFPSQTLEMIPIVAPWTDLIQVGKLNTRAGDPEELIQLEKQIDWRLFGRMAYEALVEQAGRGARGNDRFLRFYLKRDLVKHMQIRLTREIRGDWPVGSHLVAKPGVYTPKINPFGAVSVVAENGETLGLRPGEFEWVG